jgi:NADH dehydrogenase
MNPRNIVILGGTGFVGRHLVPRLTAQGHRVTVLSRNREKHPELRVLPHARVLNARVYDCEELARHLQGADVAINLVGILNERGRSGAGFRRAHVELTATLIRACREAGVRRLLQMSALNAGLGRSHYLRTRGEAEALVKDSGLHWTLFQPSVIFGHGDGLFTRFATLLRLSPVLPLARAGARFAPVFVGDVCQGFVRAVAERETIARTYPMGGPEVMTLAEIVRYTARHLGLKRLIVPLPDLLGRLQALAFDFVPGKPFSTDNYLSLLLDSVPQEDGLKALGITPTPVAAIVPAYLRGLSRQTRLDGYRRYRSR